MLLLSVFSLDFVSRAVIGISLVDNYFVMLIRLLTFYDFFVFFLSLICGVCTFEY